MADPALFISDAGTDQSFGGKQGHLGIIGDRARYTVVSRQITKSLWKSLPDLRKRCELDVGTQSVPDRTPQKASLDQVGTSCVGVSVCHGTSPLVIPDNRCHISV